MIDKFTNGSQVSNAPKTHVPHVISTNGRYPLRLCCEADLPTEVFDYQGTSRSFLVPRFEVTEIPCADAIQTKPIKGLLNIISTSYRTQ